MKKLRLLLEYGAYLIWLYDEDGELRGPVRISSEGYFADDIYLLDGTHKVIKYHEDRLIGQSELESMTNYINEEYPKLFINNEYEFSPKGFDSEEDEQRFGDAVRFVYNKLCELLGDDYEIINDTCYGMSEQDNKQDLNKSL